MEYRMRILVLDERVYKGKTRLYLSASRKNGIVKVVGKGLSILCSYDVLLGRGKELYYLQEYKLVSDYRYILKDPIALAAYSKLFSLIGSYPTDGDMFTLFTNLVNKIAREPRKLFSKVKDLYGSYDAQEVLSRIL